MKLSCHIFTTLIDSRALSSYLNLHAQNFLESSRETPREKKAHARANSWQLSPSRFYVWPRLQAWPRRLRDAKRAVGTRMAQALLSLLPLIFRTLSLEGIEAIDSIGRWNFSVINEEKKKFFLRMPESLKRCRS